MSQSGIDPGRSSRGTRTRPNGLTGARYGSERERATPDLACLVIVRARYELLKIDSLVGSVNNRLTNRLEVVAIVDNRSEKQTVAKIDIMIRTVTGHWAVTGYCAQLLLWTVTGYNVTV